MHSGGCGGGSSQRRVEHALLRVFWQVEDVNPFPFLHQARGVVPGDGFALVGKALDLVGIAHGPGVATVDGGRRVAVDFDDFAVGGQAFS